MKQKSAEQRRALVLEAAVSEFAEFGFHGATTARIAGTVGISQSYVMHLFGSKKKLFMESMKACTDRLIKHLEDVQDTEDTLGSLTTAYQVLIQEQPNLMKFQLQAWAASAQDDEVRSACAQQFRALWATIAHKLGIERTTAAPLMAALSFFNVAVTLGIQDDQDCAIAGLIQDFY